VHPAWFGSWCWRDIVALLRAAGHDVCAPTLTGLGERVHLASRRVSLSTHVEDVANAIMFDDLNRITLVGNSSGGTVITAVADRIPERIERLVYLDAFVPSHGESTSDLIAPDRWHALQQLVDSEGDGWLLPRWGPAPWESILREVWQVTDDAKFQWVLPRLRPTPIGHFTEPVQLVNPNRAHPHRVYIRCPQGPAPFDKPAAVAQASPDWTYREMEVPHIPFITHPKELVDVLLQVSS
jgi:pimeloyl-ACP methyl ester carboxylesterase